MGLLMADTCLVDTAVLLVTIVLLLYYWSTSTFNYWNKRGVKTVSKLTPFLGSLKDLLTMKTQVGLHYTALYKELEGERFGGYFKMRQPAIMIRDPELVKHVMIKDFASFMNNDVDSSEDSKKTNPMFGYNIFGMKDAEWKYTRSKVSPIFSGGKLAPMYPLIMEVCDELKANLQRKIDTGEPEFEAKNLAGNYTTDVVGSWAFDLKCNSLQDENNKFRNMSRDIMTPSLIRGIFIMIIIFFPTIGKILIYFGVKFLPDSVVNFFRDLVRKAMEYREKTGVKRTDLIQLLMQLKKLGCVEEDKEEVKKVDGGVEEDQTGKIEFTHDALTAQAVSFFFNGYETSSTTLSFAMHELAVNPDIQKRLRVELRKYVAKNDDKLTYEALKECAYLDCVIQETLRKYPPAGALAKTCTQRYTIPDSDVTIEVGTPILIPVYAMHHDPQYFPDPETFDPERFNEENKKNRVACTYLPFGEGPRICIGMRFALAQVKAALSTVILNFEVTRSERTQHPVVLDPTFFLISAKGGLHIKVQPLTE